ncbi:GTPase Era, mitochondrial-like [Penaeus chinensis]|uniref:GTPase Era, mitochondrial-like n=1 Tax=Penaeus chinensis TaxID=139456 RepID=UPI001FB63D75|nr:GTPase Era, mitochondrial-like [Penaeus chinensis]
MVIPKTMWHFCVRSFHRFNAVARSSLPSGNENVWDAMYKRGIPRTMDEMSVMLGERVDSPPNSRLLKIAIVGVPNCGKSTLINSLVGRKVCSVSSKVHTTEVSARAVHNVDSTQMVFLDTPGLVTPQEVSKHSLNRSLLREAEISLHEADVMAVIHDVSNKYTCNSLHPRVLRLLALYPTTPSILILNKVDLVKHKQRLLDVTRTITEGIVGGNRSHVEKKKDVPLNKEKFLRKAKKTLQSKETCTEDKIEKKSENTLITGQIGLPRDISQISEQDILEGKVRLTEQEINAFIENRTGWPLFQEVFMISALSSLGVDDLKDFFYYKAYEAPWIFNSQMLTDQNPQDIALMTIREKFLDAFKNEIPYNLKFTIEHWDLSEEEILYITVQIGCKRQGLARVIIGSGGKCVIPIAQEAEQDLRNTFCNEVKLRLNVVYDPALKKK